MTTRRIHLVSTMKNEGPYILEWVAYHRSIGVTDFTIFSNDCTDGSNLILNRLDQMGIIRHFDNPLGPNMDPQRAAYSRANAMPEVRASDWVLIVDADEFLNVRVGDHSINALIDACGGDGPDAPDAISINWRMMGSNGLAHMAPEPVTRRFTRGATLDKPESASFWGFKTLFRPQKFDYFGVHRPKFDKKKTTDTNVRWVNGAGRPMDDSVIGKGWRSNAETVAYDFAQVNHYAIKSRQEFLLKRLRGTANSKNEGRIDMKYWEKYDVNVAEDTSIMTDRLAQDMADLAADPDLGALLRASAETSRRALDYQMNDKKLKRFVETGIYSEDG